jgi:RecA/RadA recombinase
MATKKKATEKKVKPLTVKVNTQSVLKAIQKEFKGSKIRTLADRKKEVLREVIPTGIDVLDNWIFGKGGIPVCTVGELFGDPDSGKAQPLDCTVVTPDGNKQIGDLRVGDIICDTNGGTQSVLGVYPQGKKSIYKVTFSDGSTTRCCDDHLWKVTTPRTITKNKPHKIMALHEMKNSLRQKDGKLNYHIPLIKPILFNNKKKISLDPYMLGLLLGDDGNSIVFSNPERDLQKSLIKKLPNQDTGVVFKDGSTTTSVRIKRKVKNNKVSETSKILDTLGLLGKKSTEKFIPKKYLYTTKENRLKLLRGLIDTDGHVHKTSYVEYSTSSKQLADDTVFLVRSLGGIAKVTTRIPKYTHKGKVKKGKLSYRIYIIFNDLKPFNSKKHIGKFIGREIPRYRSIVSVRYVGKKECQCIKVSSKDNLYITDDFIPTHNSSLGFLFMAAAQRAGG